MAGTASANWATATAGEVVSFAALQDTQHPDFLQEAAVLSAHFHVRRYVVVQLAPQQQHLIELTKQAYTYYFTQPEADAVLAETGKRVHAVRADRLDPDCHSDLDAYKYSVDLGNFPYKAAAFLEGVTRTVLSALLSGIGLQHDTLDVIVDGGLHTSAECPPRCPSELEVAQFAGPPTGEETRLAAKPHKGVGVLSAIADDTAGLQVLDVDGNWQQVTLRTGQVALIAGHTLEVATAGRLPAALHRVVVQGVRLSLAFKLRAWPDAIIDFRDELEAAGISLVDTSSQPIRVSRVMAEFEFAGQAYAYAERLRELKQAGVITDEQIGPLHLSGPLFKQYSPVRLREQKLLDFEQSIALRGKCCGPRVFTNGTIYVRTLTGKTITLPVSSNMTVLDVKVAIQGREGYTLEQQRLIANGEQLEDSHTLYQCGMLDQDVCHLVLRLRGC